MKIYYHYTRLENAKKIIQSKNIKPASLYIAKDEKAINWLSTNKFNEASAYPQIPLERMIEMGYVRFIVKDIKHLKIAYWKTIAKKANMSSEIQENLRNNPGGGNPSEWYATLKQIPLACIEKIEYMDNNQKWIPIDKNDLMSLDKA